jgi:hypothetical protein
MLTEEERAELDMVAFVGLDILRSDDLTSRHPCWLCCSEEVKKAARTRAVEFINEKAIVLTPITEDRAEEFLRENVKPIKPAYERWVKAEEALKQRREEGDPTAFFFGAGQDF